MGTAAAGSTCAYSAGAAGDRGEEGAVFTGIEGLGLQLQHEGGLAPMMAQLEQTMAANPRYGQLGTVHGCILQQYAG